MMAVINRDAGERFELRLTAAALALGRYVQKMPARVGYDFTLGDGHGRLVAVEAKCICGPSVLRLSHFTAIEIRTAEEMHAAFAPYWVAFPYYSTIACVDWVSIRDRLLHRCSVDLARDPCRDLFTGTVYMGGKPLG